MHGWRSAGTRLVSTWRGSRGCVARSHRSSAARWAVDTVVNLEEFPLNALESADAHRVADGCREKLRADGYCVMRRFLRTEAVAAALAEVRAREGACFVHSRRVNMWGESPHQHGDRPLMALRRMSSIDSYGVVARDELCEHGALRTLYSSPAFAAFAASIAGHDQLHAWGDELAGCSGEILRDGQSRAWRFAQAPVVAVAVLQRPETGGLALGFRNVDLVLDAEGDVEAAADTHEMGTHAAAEALRTILHAAEIEHEAGEMGVPMSWRQIMEDMDPEAGAIYHKNGPLSVQALGLEEGDLLLMQASRSVLRFSQVLGERPLVTATFCFDSDAGTRLTGNERKRLYGRKKPGVSPPASSTFAHCYRPLTLGDARQRAGGGGTQVCELGLDASQYIAVVSERSEGQQNVRELVRVVLAFFCMVRMGRDLTGAPCAQEADEEMMRMLQELESFGDDDADADDAVQASLRVRHEFAVPASRQGRACVMRSWFLAWRGGCQQR